MFGIQHNDNGSIDDLDTASEWQGRLEYIKRKTNHIVSESEHRVNATIKLAEKRILEQNSSLRKELKKEIYKVLKAA